MSRPSELNVPVLLIFFARPDTFSQVFEAVRQARPSTLLLWQDGPRPGREDDLAGIARCREIVENIDWDCTVYRQYHEENMGCDPSTFNAHSWAFSLVERCIVLEDDQLPDPSFFPYCAELLERYADDDRVNHICGYNVLGESTDCPNSYLFADYGSGAWASWRRVAQGWDSTYAFLHDEYAMKNLRAKYGKRFDGWYRTAVRHEATGKAFWESILGMDCLLNNRVAIIPQVNLASNIGLTAGSTHSNAVQSLLPKSQQQIFFAESRTMEFPLRHPAHIVPDYGYMESVARLLGNGHPVLSLMRRLYYLGNCILHGRFDLLAGMFRRRFPKKK